MGRHGLHAGPWDGNIIAWPVAFSSFQHTQVCYFILVPHTSFTLVLLLNPSGRAGGDPARRSYLPLFVLVMCRRIILLAKVTGAVYLSRGMRVGVHAPCISHLLFADDCILFTEASQRGSMRDSKRCWIFVVAGRASW